MADLAGLSIERIELGTPEYLGMLDLRDRVLRRPLGLIISAADLAHDAHADLLVARLEAHVVGCCLLTPESPEFLQLRAMAVEPELHGRGVGRMIVEGAEARAKARGVPVIALEARQTAIGFYARLGYLVDGEEYLKVGIPHRLMRKRLG